MEVNNTQNLTDLQIMERHITLQRLPLLALLPVTALFALIWVVGVVGNVVVLIVVRRQKAFPSVANYFIANLAVSDLILLQVGQCVFFSVKL